MIGAAIVVLSVLPGAFFEGRAIYRGVGFAGDRSATDYAGLPQAPAPVEPHQTHAQIGVFEQVSATSARRLFPYPILESTFDILHLSR